MVNYMEELSVTEADNLKKTIAALFRQTCILQMKYDPVTLVPRDNLQYEICTRHRKFIEDYLSVLNCELVHDPQEHIYRLHGDGIAIEKINATVTKVILLVKLIYRDKILGEGLKARRTERKERFITSEYIKEGAVVIDVGMHRDEANHLCGDVDFADVEPHSSAITPVPGGVGPMTIAMLMNNCVETVRK